MGKVAEVKAAGRLGSLNDMHGDELIPANAAAASLDSESVVFRSWRDVLQNDAGLRYSDFKKQLKPRYGCIWVQVAIAYAAIACIATGLVFCQLYLSSWWQVGAVGLSAGIVVGYLVAFIALWFHEAAHYNVHRDRVWNDRFANVFIGLLILHEISRYRQFHFVHHKYLGTITDTERSYFDALNARYLIEALTGIRILRILLVRRHASLPGARAAIPKAGILNWVIPVSALLHAGIVAASLYFHQYALIVAWVTGVFIFAPFFGALRQVLEHRRPDADPSCDYSKVGHGEYTRVFARGPIANTFGGAGFNRHLIHHWDPSISCTCFDEVERFLEMSQLRDFYAARRTTYGEALVTLFNQSPSGNSIGA